ncbi:MAG: GNAT family N-acetyltransferase [Clostridia bacterium]|nr:GNAT family N-acetyltransferase [Clostridia bacterium]
MSGFVIRYATVEDAEKLLQIYSYYVLNTAISFEYTVPTLDEFKTRIENTLKKYPYLVLEADGEIMGYSYAGPFKTREAYKFSVENTIYLKNGVQKNGYGKALLLALEKELSEMGYTNANACIAYTENNDEYLNNNSMEFHEHMGYRFVGVFHKCAYKFDRWYDMIWMEKFVGEHGKK